MATIIICKICNKKFKIKPYHKNKANFCSLKCFGTTIKNNPNLKKFAKGHIPWNKGKKNCYFEEVKQKMSQSLKGRISWNKGLKLGDHPSIEKYGSKLRGRKRLDMIGVNNPSWKGGINPINFTIRNSIEMNQWRREILKRDDYRCYDCGQRGGKLHIDHILPFVKYPRLRFDLNNGRVYGRVLCKKCHVQKTRSDWQLTAIYA